MLKRKESIKFSDFMTGEYKHNQKGKTTFKTASTALFCSVATSPTFAFASGATGDEAFNKIYQQVLQIFDYGVAFVFVFSGALWMFNNQSKAIQYMIGGSIGYFIVRHADDIQKFLSQL